jgi:hypothetical protein
MRRVMTINTLVTGSGTSDRLGEIGDPLIAPERVRSGPVRRRDRGVDEQQETAPMEPD